MNKGKINILPAHIANKIAAGEVVQRPASVVKELLENSIDAGANNIELFIRRAGKLLIQVVDDGEGMKDEDASLSIQRHATSKISAFEDLEAIRTFGFRGEALSSIAAVSNLEIKTETKDEDIGALIRVGENFDVSIEKGSFSKGTSISVKNLFYNTPARRNFLKSNATELKHIIEAFKRISISNPDVSFKLINDDDQIFDYPSGSQNDRIKAVFADNIFDAVVEVGELTEYMNLSGYVAKPTFLKRSRDDQYLFINRRYVKSKIVNHAVFSAYENILNKGDYPFFLLFMEIDPAKIDINVHPQKLEVKFEDEKNLYAFVKAVVKKGLGSYDLVPNLTFESPNPERDRLKYETSSGPGRKDFSDRPSFDSKRSSIHRKEMFSENDISILFSGLEEEPESGSNAIEGKNREADEIFHTPDPASASSETDKSSQSNFIVALHNKYILAQIKSGLMVIDQHVAHERILYEKALSALSSDLPFSQQLLFAQTVHTDPADYDLLKELKPHLNQLGFSLKFFSGNTVVIEGVPPDVKVGTEKDTLLDLLLEYRNNERTKNLEITDNIAKSYSCKAAIKAGDILSKQEMHNLVDQLFATSMPYVCPHGRPIVIKISLDEFDKKFGRT